MKHSYKYSSLSFNAVRERFCAKGERERTCTHLSLPLGGRTRAERSWKRLDALHPLLSDILTNSGAPRADNYFCGPQGPRLPLASSFTAGPPSCVALAPLALFLAVVHGDFSCWKPPPFCAFFLRGPEGPAGKGWGGVVKCSGVLNHLETHTRGYEPSSYSAPTPPFRVILRSISRSLRASSSLGP